MKKQSIIQVFWVLLVSLLLVSLLLMFTSCGNPLGEREYLEDIYIDIPDTDCRLLIKEWNYLLGSGEEVYFVSPSEKEPRLLGKLTGGDDGYCPFNDGKYKVEFSDGSVRIFWCFNGSDTCYCRSERFVLPEIPD
jgi:hypothetical protein